MKREKSETSLKKSKNTKIILGIFALIFISAFFVGATVLSGGLGVKAVRNVPERVTFSGDCLNVNNRHSSNDAFIPNKSSTEWNMFKTNKPDYIETTGCSQGTISCRDISSHSMGLDYTYSNIISNKVSIFQGSTKLMTFSTACSDPVSDGGNNFCRFNQATCPAGWASYKSWSTATSTSCEGGCSSCVAEGHSWSDKILNTCSYQLRFIWCLSPSTCTATKTQIGCIPLGVGSYDVEGLSLDTEYTFYLRDGDTSTSPLLAQVSCTTDPINPVEQDCWDLLQTCTNTCPDCALIEDPEEWDICWNEAASCQSDCQDSYPCTSDGGCAGCPLSEWELELCSC